MPFRSNLKPILPFARTTPHQAASEDENDQGQPKTPNCPHCKIDTLWYQSRLQRENGRSKIVHSFSCPNCGLVVQTEEPAKHALRVV